MTASYRIGIGYDIHRVAEDRPLLLGGVRIESSFGLAGHSDGDAVLHAVIDALLGAAGLPDIGDMFPDTDPAYRNVDSRKLLSETVAKVAKAGYVPNNIDLIVHAEQPRLTEHKRTIAESIAGLVGLDPSAVSVKAKTNEGLGPLGHAEGIACTAAAMVVKSTGTQVQTQHE